MRHMNESKTKFILVLNCMNQFKLKIERELMLLMVKNDMRDIETATEIKWNQIHASKMTVHSIESRNRGSDTM